MELVLAQNITTDSIYSADAAPVPVSGAILLRDRVTEYQLNLTNDLAISIDTSQLAEFIKYNCEFTLYVNSDAEHVINLAGCDIQQIQVYRGKTKIIFSHRLGGAVWNVNITEIANQLPVYVKPQNNYDIPNYNRYGLATTTLNNGYAVGVEVFYWMSTPDTPNSQDKYWEWSTSELTLYTIFPAPFIMTTWRLHVGTTLTYNLPQSITVYGSNDYNNWVEVSSVAELTYTVSQEIKIFAPTIQRPYRAYKFVFTVGSGNIVIVPVSINGYKCPYIGNLNFYRYPKIAGATGEYTVAMDFKDGAITQNSDHGVYFLTYTDAPSGQAGRAEFSRSNSDVSWDITYTFPQAVRFEGFMSKLYTNYTANWCNGWFKWEGSNDGTNWTRLCELRKPFQNYYVNNMYLFYMCHTQGTYRYFRIVIYTVADEFSNSFLSSGLFPIYTIPDEYRDFDTIVPIMESDTQDGYTVSSSSVTSGYTYYMYDNNPNTYCQGAISAGQWITLIDMGSSVVLKGFQLQAASDNYSKMPITFSVQGSADNSSWQLLQSYALGSAAWTANSQVQSFTVNNITGYRYYRIVVTATQEGGSDVRIAGLGWSSAAGLPPIAYYTEQSLVPAMSSNSQDGYVASATSEYNNNEGAWRAFDGTTAQWTTVDGYNTNIALEIELPQAHKCSTFMLYTSDANNRIPQTFKIEASNNNSDWAVLYQDLSGANLSTNTRYYFDSAYPDTAFKYYRLFVLTNKGAGYISLREFQLLDRTYYSN